MTTVTEVDAGGASMTITLVDGDYHMPPFDPNPKDTEKRVKAVPEFKCRPDDVFLFSAIKSGTHWVWEIVSMLYNGRAETIQKSKVTGMLEFPSDKEAEPSPRILNSHLKPKYLPKAVFQEKRKAVLVLRNPKDVVVSYFFHAKGNAILNYEGTFENFLKMSMEGRVEYNGMLGFVEYVRDWDKILKEKKYPIHVVFYEDLQENGLVEIKKLAKFLEVKASDELLKAVFDKCRFEIMKLDKKDLQAVPLKKDFSLFRKGKIGDWNNTFTDAQKKMYEAFLAEKLDDCTLKFRYEYKK
ncbi:sulfotransferase 1 family member D1-like [Mya arenaria]|uniref:sulfotransferase 1 family member D1-like n=1 Tax=Mya arenaria TaxID=6604 RepID=UPI0022E87C1A|nr:sulfotransferase 1 family member D1-like [Mya arenaria]